MVVSIDDEGTVRFLITEESQVFVSAESVVRRASHVEPWNLMLRLVFRILRKIGGEHSKLANWTRTWPCWWRVNLSPVNGPIIPIEFASRATAIEFEVDWLEKNFL